MYLQSTVDKLIRKTNVSLVVGTSSWREQFVDAMSVSAGETMSCCFLQCNIKHCSLNGCSLTMFSINGTKSVRSYRKIMLNIMNSISVLTYWLPKCVNTYQTLYVCFSPNIMFTLYVEGNLNAPVICPSEWQGLMARVAEIAKHIYVQMFMNVEE